MEFKNSNENHYFKAWFPRTMFYLTKIICRRNFVSEFAFTHSKDYLYYANFAHLCHRYLTMKLRHIIEFTRAYCSATNLLCQRKLSMETRPKPWAMVVMNRLGIFSNSVYMYTVYFMIMYTIQLQNNNDVRIFDI